ncbi:MAG: transcription elongation factor Spt5 [Candidatus Nanoarchaeia archaeon]|nr:transcription elongation factor Spt5 [Candidatus Nanoarchaeia archaeon]
MKYEPKEDKLVAEEFEKEIEDEETEETEETEKEESDEEDEEESDDEQELEEGKVFAVRVTAGRERQVVDRIYSRVVKDNDKSIYAILYPYSVRGYIFVEANSRDDVVQAVYGITHVKGVVAGNVNFEEVSHFLSKAPRKISISEKDIVELVSGPFKGEKAKVIRINKVKEEVVVELLESAVPIPVTTKLESVRIVSKEEMGDEE